MNCNVCGFPLESDSHIYNVNCVASNAEYDQVLAEVREAWDTQPPVDPEAERRLVTVAMEAMRDQLALARFKRMMRKP